MGKDVPKKRESTCGSLNGYAFRCKHSSTCDNFAWKCCFLGDGLIVFSETYSRAKNMASRVLCPRGEPHNYLTCMDVLQLSEEDLAAWLKQAGGIHLGP